MKSIIAWLVLGPSLMGSPGISSMPLAQTDTVVLSSADTVVSKRQARLYLDAQERLNETYSELKKANNEIEKLNDQLSKKDSELETLRNSVTVLSEQISSLSNSDKARKSLEKEKEKLQGSYNDLKKKYDELKKNDFETQLLTLRGSYQESLKEISDVKADLQKSRDEVDALKNQLLKLGTVKEAWFDQLVSSAEKDWLSSPFSRIDPESLKELLPSYVEYASENQNVRIAGERLQTLLNDLETYNKSLQAIDSPYDDGNVKSLLDQARNASLKDTEESRKKEWDEIIDKLEHYGDRVELCQDLVDSIEDSLRGKSSARWSTVIDNTIQDEEENFATKTAIDSIPWLRMQLDEYIKVARTSGPDAPNKYRDAIKGIVVK